ncbi:hypothetical protein D9Q98_006806 [Chlorella vulgaris]|uniref:Uncharacterized protein n=1 Tax=Chlorella vulgaris TaxID=3077 RepID=A0A9D4YUJ2_CHLVU|nr:hypothetical protein D9Q98_006806 [Chlorella vulgaris]
MDASAASTALAAVASTAVFEGVALFVAVGDPCPSYADQSQDATEMLRDWRRMFPAAKAFQMKALVLGSASAAITAWGLRDSNTQAAAAFGIAVAANVATVGYTVGSIEPLNNRMLPLGAVEKRETEEGIRGMLQQWSKMHGLRTVLGAVALGASLYGTHTLLTSK